MFTNKLKALTVSLKRWHKDNFGDMDSRVKKFEEVIKKIDDIVSAGSYDGTMDARRKALVTCCVKWYVRKEIHWKQMSRLQHARDMDKNIRYFHNLASARGRNNRIDSLVINERLARNQARIRNAITGFYKELYRQEYASLIGIRNGLVKQIDDEEAAVLEEMHQLRKYERQFGIVSPVKYQNSKLPTDANVTLVALAPKFVGAKEIKDLRPIGMVGCVYKVIYKVLKQAAIVKLDFQKAYDRVRSSFVDIVLQKMGFGLRWRTWVKECVTIASMSMLINGSPSKPFKMERGLKQGDPLSHFLFVLVVDVLHKMVGEAEMETLVNYKRLLRCFELMSGLCINFDKSSLIPVNCEKE
ncbi:uncharacterized protein LOC127747630 [Arachis duranensis]|uniref:Uncharacterized protein LOC127747630 n=1 Tax=Arachis duranensis TaxID=130453 RepID=A0A9C6WQ47_ARADU|nr:uncharacterized protein LOC127747630 [Arachis duranensis]